MDVRNCKNCGRLFNYIGGAPLCQACQKKMEEKFQEVKAYLNVNPNSSVDRVSEELDVSVKQIRQWIREERLTLSVAGADGVVCEQCGAPICTGRFCDKCKMEMANTFAGAIQKPKPQEPQKAERDKNRMRFL
ncbi:MAG: flagellar protein [Roseburia sp.]|nr:flagellar protein [Roseburia sp.]